MTIGELEADDCQLLAECFRCLRGACAQSADQRWRLGRCGAVLLQLWLRLNALELSVSTVNSNETVALRCGLQFFVNLVSGDSVNKTAVWKMVLPSMRMHLKSVDEKASSYACALLYNCWPLACTELTTTAEASAAAINDTLSTASAAAVTGGMQATVALPSSERPRPDESVAFGSLEILVVADVVEILACGHDLEWGFFLVEKLLAKKSFLHSLWPHVGPNARQLVLELSFTSLEQLRERTARSNATEYVGVPAFHCSNALFLGQLFADEVEEFVRLQASGDSECMQEEAARMGMMATTLKCLCVCTAVRPSPFASLLENSGLMQAALTFLKELHVHRCSQHTAVQSGDVTTAARETLASFVRYSVQLVGNLCYRCRVNQDLVRNADGLSLILDHTSIDADSPFTSQWALMAIRNLCEGNEENQDFLRRMRSHGWSPKTRSLLDELGLDRL